MPIVPDLAVCNEALAELPSNPIQTVGEASLGARECNRSYAAVVKEILSKCDWEGERTRAALAPIANDRPNEWAYAYALPDDLINPLKLVPNFAQYDGLWVNEYQLNGQIITYPNWPLIYEGRYEIAKGVFYSFEGIAILEYTSSTDVSRIPALMRRAIVLELASRIVLPVTKDQKRKQSLMQQAALALDEAKVDNMNRQPRNYGPTGPSSIQQARMGWYGG